MAEQLKVQAPQQAKHRFNQEDDSASIAEWNRLLKKFHAIEEARPKDLKAKLEDLIKEASNNAYLSHRQADGIVGRANNVLNDTYGKTKKQFN